MLIASLVLAARLASQTAYEKDMAFAVDAIAKEAAALIEFKKLPWPAVAKEFLARSKKVQTNEDHFALLVRLLARLRDGHARVELRDKTKGLKPPEDLGFDVMGSGISFCQVGNRIYLKSTWSAAASAGFEPGQEVVKVSDLPPLAFLEKSRARLRDVNSFSTDQHEAFHAGHAGLGLRPGTRLEIEVRAQDGKTMKRTITPSKAALAARGPAFFPKGTTSHEDLNYAMLPSGYGYLHVRRCPNSVVDQIDAVLKKLDLAKGLVLDFRANSGGGFDHEAFMGRFVPKGTTMDFGHAYASAGETVCVCPIVVIIDATIVSAGETAAGMFKEDGRAYVIGESKTAGMSSQKTTIELPSGLFGLYVSTRSNKQRWNGGRGIEGLGIEPHEIVPYDPKDLARGEDTLIRRAETILSKFPAAKVPYKAPQR